MEFDWTTFILEIINFLILIWILSRFLYRPILRAIHQRQADIEQRRQQIAGQEQSARELQQQYENRLTQWEQEKTAARTALQQEIEAERQRLLAELRQSLAAEQDKAAAVARKALADQHAVNEQQALRQGADFAARLLARLATPELETRITQLVLNDLGQLAERDGQTRQQLRQQANHHATVDSAFELPVELRDALRQALQQLIGRDLQLEARVDSKLLAGIRITLGAWSLQANLQDELRHFAESANGNP